MFVVQMRVYTKDRKEILVPALRKDGSWRPFHSRQSAKRFLNVWIDKVISVEGGEIIGIIFCPSTRAREEISFESHK